MRNNTSLARWIIGFLCLNLYAHGIPKLIALDVLPWLTYAAGFFLLAFLVARFITGVIGLRSFGLPKQRGWFSDVGIGFAIGAFVWGLKYLLYYGFGKFEVNGLMDSGYILMMLAQALLGMLVAAAINDIMIRGYWFAYLRKTENLKWFILFSTVLYTLDDFWNEGFSWQNVIFSTLLGSALAYTVIKTGAIWMAIGIHWGSNMLYRVMAGFNGQGIWKLTNETDGILYEYISLLVTVLLLPLVYFMVKNRTWLNVEMKPRTMSVQPDTEEQCITYS